MVAVPALIAEDFGGDKLKSRTRYVMSSFQHPRDWEAPLHDIVKPLLGACRTLPLLINACTVATMPAHAVGEITCSTRARGPYWRSLK